MAGIKLNSRDWAIDRTAVSPGGARRGAPPVSSFPRMFLTGESTVAEEFNAQPSAVARRAATPPGPLDFSYDLDAGEAALLAIRHPSGALTFHLPVETTRRGEGKAPQVSFTVDVRSVDVETGRLGIVSAAVKAILIKVGQVVVDKAVSFVLPKLAAAFEKAIWNRKGLHEGWLKVTRDTLRQGPLAAGTPSSADRSLLFLHGTFSNAASAFPALASSNSNFFDRVAPLYGDRIFAFDHFSISRTPEENARMLLDSLPAGVFTFDVVTHSRGGLVLRNLVERASVFGPLSQRFKLGRVVLVASPNEGTPLATPQRWQDTVGWLANILELFPDNPFTTGAEFVANALVWLARHASGDLPGLHSMDGAGNLIADLQAPPGPPPDAYSALVANYNPTGDVLKRMLDTGVDQFFGSANDLVVPSEGGWRVDHSGVIYVPGSRIGCFGPGGNLAPDSVTHIGFFSHQETVDFLVRALLGQDQQLTPVDPSKALPDRRLLRSAGAVAGAGFASAGRTGPSVAPRAAPESAAGAGDSRIVVDGAAVVASDTFHLIVLPSSESDKHRSQILAQYGSARVFENFNLGGKIGNAGERWKTIIEHDKNIRKYVDQNIGKMPDEKDLREFGCVLFETLFPGAVRRLYDTARSLQRSERLNVIFTSTVPWVADLPWEFSYDPVRKTSLATEELHFIRNVMTAVPAEIIDDRKRLRILVVSAQPIRLAHLSIEEEQAVIRRGFEPLRQAGLADVEVLARATPESLHGYIATGNFSVVHFIGHGKFDRETDRGYLIFQDDQGNSYPIDDRSVKEIFCGRGLRLVFLNACQTGQGGRAAFNRGVAPALVEGGVPIVVANQYSVLDASATFFAQHFYWSLAHGMGVGEAARESRIAVNYSLTGESIDWAIPVVYARDPNSRLSPERPINRRTMPSPAVRAPAGGSAAEHKVRIAVWDIHSQFPQLHYTLDRMNAAQQYYGFDIVDLSLPVDSWYIDEEGKRYLDANKFAKRLAPQILQLGVQFLSAIVDERMACDVETKKARYDIYGWWPGKDEPPVLVFSTYEMGIEPKGPATEHALANLAVAGISDYLLGGDHKTGPVDCPRYYNPDRKLSLLTGRQKFCKPCADELRKSHPEEFKAFNAILAAFD